MLIPPPRLLLVIAAIISTPVIAAIKTSLLNPGSNKFKTQFEPVSLM
jgi:hypothetical protein